MVIAFSVAIIFTSFFSFVDLGLDSLKTMQVIFFDYSPEGRALVLRIINVQNIMWWIFFIGSAELYYRNVLIKKNTHALSKKYLSEQQFEIYTSEDIIKFRKNLLNEENLLADLIKKLVLRYQASRKSVDETHQMLNSQLQMMQYKLDVDYNLIKYITWLIPTLGFIGTVIGIALALNFAGQPGAAESAGFLEQLTSKLSIAFYTTLVALIMSAILVFGQNLIQAKEEMSIQQTAEYCLNFFINKLSS